MRKVIACILLLFCSSYLNADEIYLSNSDKITGDIIEETSSNIIIETQAMGRYAYSFSEEMKW